MNNSKIRENNGVKKHGTALCTTPLNTQTKAKHGSAQTRWHVRHMVELWIALNMPVIEVHDNVQTGALYQLRQTRGFNARCVPREGW